MTLSDDGSPPQSRNRATPADELAYAKKRRHEEITMSQGYSMALNASRTGGYSAFYSAPPGSAHPVLAPRSAFLPDHQYNVGVDNLPVGAGADDLQGFSPGLDDEPSAAAFARMSRSERKRFREKKRRSEVNKGFDDLMTVLLKVEYVSIGAHANDCAFFDPYSSRVLALFAPSLIQPRSES